MIDMPFSDEPVCLFDHFDPWISIGKTIGKTAMTSCELTRDVFFKIELCMDYYKLNVHSCYIPDIPVGFILSLHPLGPLGPDVDPLIPLPGQ